MPKRDSYIFYRSFEDALRTLPPDEELKLRRSIADFSLDFKKPKDLGGIAKTIWNLMEPNLNANNNRYINGLKGSEHGKKGGRPKTPKKPLANPKETPSLTPNKDKDKDKDVNKDNKEKGFVDFWDYYHLHTGKPKTDKDAALTHWKKLTLTEKRLAYKNVIPYSNTLEDKKFLCKARTYISNKRYNDEFTGSVNGQRFTNKDEKPTHMVKPFWHHASGEWFDYGSSV